MHGRKNRKGREIEEDMKGREKIKKWNCNWIRETGSKEVRNRMGESEREKVEKRKSKSKRARGREQVEERSGREQVKESK